jgi:hypothetical protein
MAVKKRCIFCRKVVRADGTCQNPKCPLYKPEESDKNSSEANEDNGSEDTTEQ